MIQYTDFQEVFAGKTVLITGHTGFKGSWLTTWLNALGANVVGYSRDPAAHPKQRNFTFCRLDERITHLTGDIRDTVRVKEVFLQYEPEIVFHLAAQPLVNIAYEEPRTTIETNLNGTLSVLEAIRQTESVRAAVFITTDKVYEDQHWIWGYRETDQLGGYDPYSSSKSMAELCVQSYRRSWDEKWTQGGALRLFATRPVAIATARAGNVIGGGDFSPDRLVPDCMKALLRREQIRLRSPDAIRPWQHVMEPLSGYLLLGAHLLHPGNESFSEAWNFGPNEIDAVTCERIVREAISAWGDGAYEAGEPVNSKRHETHLLKLNWVKAASRLGWRPAYSWQEAVGATVEWFKEYQRQGGTAGESVDMYDFCLGQIDAYMHTAGQGSTADTVELSRA